MEHRQLNLVEVQSRMPLIHTIIRKLTGPKCPVSADDKNWIETRLRWLQGQFGGVRLDFPVLKPTFKIFPRTWNGSVKECSDLLTILCEYMDIPRESVDLRFFEGGQDPLRHSLPSYELSESGAAGMYHGRSTGGKFIISVSGEQRTQPDRLIATMCHELGHVLLLGGNRIRGDEEDHEQLTDLLTVYFGAGIFTANAALQFEQWTDVGTQGWRTSRHGYLSEAQLGYALACYSWLRRDRERQGDCEI